MEIFSACLNGNARQNLGWSQRFIIWIITAFKLCLNQINLFYHFFALITNVISEEAYHDTSQLNFCLKHTPLRMRLLCDDTRRPEYELFKAVQDCNLRF